MIDLGKVDFEKGGGVVTVVCQDHLSGAVLMVANANLESLERTLESGEMHYWSRSRGLWHKGSVSGNRQRVVELRYDCDADAILARVRPLGPACHTGSDSCFGSLGDSAGILERLDHVIGERAVAAGAERVVAPITKKLRDESPTVGDNPESGYRHHPAVSRDTESSPERAPGLGNRSSDAADHHQSSAAESEPRQSHTRRLLLDRNLRLKKLGEEAAELVTACADGDRARACEEAADLIYHTLVALRAAGASLRDVQRVLDQRRAAAPE
jgi:phosphoribosyl-ATP pyrophosphohydrolase/phosphoribosyl-AMP cyclohydrolase